LSIAATDHYKLTMYKLKNISYATAAAALAASHAGITPAQFVQFNNMNGGGPNTEWTYRLAAPSVHSAEIAVGEFSGGGGGGVEFGFAPFPVEWLAVSAEWQTNNPLSGGAGVGSTARISWATASETNNAYFAVERSSDGAQFEQIGAQAGAGTSTEIHEYSFDDAAAASLARNGKPLFYRIKQVDMDGNASYSETVELALEGAATQVAVYPNPAKDALHIRLTNAPATATLKLYDVLGQEVLSQPLTTSQIAVDISALAQGVYMWRVSIGTKTFTGKVVKE
jgi:hypothetical protein